jgi:hypothetical protein
METVVSIPDGVELDTPEECRRKALAAAGRRRSKYRPSEAADEAIREAYRRAIEENDRQVIKRTGRLLGWPRAAVIKRAAELGLARVKEPDWSLAEIAILREYARYGAQAIREHLKRAGFRRTKTGIELKRKRLDLVRDPGGYSAYSLSKLCGIDQHGVMRWIALGWLAAEKRGTNRTEQQGGDSHFIRIEDVQRFIWEHPDEMDLRRVEPRWFLNLVSDGKICL